MRFALTFAVNNAETKVNLNAVQISSATENLERLIILFFCFRIKFQPKISLSFSPSLSIVINTFDLVVQDRTLSFDRLLFEVSCLGSSTLIIIIKIGAI